MGSPLIPMLYETQQAWIVDGERKMVVCSRVEEKQSSDGVVVSQMGNSDFVPIN